MIPIPNELDKKMRFLGFAPGSILAARLKVAIRCIQNVRVMAAMLFGTLVTISSVPAEVMQLSITGRVIDKLNGLPVANISVSSGGGSKKVSAVTDADGRYELRGVSSDASFLYTSRSGGFLEQIRKLHASSAGQRISGFDFQLEKGLSLRGRVLDPAGKPLSGVIINAIAAGYPNEEFGIVGIHATKTDEFGAFHFDGLRRAFYYLQALAGVMRISTGNAISERRAVVRTYYPGSISPEGAESINLRAASEDSIYEIRAAYTETFCATAHISGFANRSRPVVFTLSEVLLKERFVLAVGTALPGSDIQVCGLSRGRYDLSSELTLDSGMAGNWSHDFTIKDHSISLPEVLPIAPLTLSGRMALGDSPERSIPLTVRIGFRAAESIYPSHPLETAPDLNGKFAIVVSPNDEYFLQISGLPDGFYLERATVAGQEVGAAAFFPGSGNLDLTLRSDGPRISGQVVDHEGNALGNAVVVLVPQSDNDGRVLQTAAAQDGWFSFRGIHPGEYYLIAVSNVEPNLISGTELFRASRMAATQISLPSNSIRAVRLEAVKSPL